MRVTLGFKATYMPFYGRGGSIYPYHHGIDYADELDTPVVVNGTQVGLMGKTGAATGVHVHVDKSKSYPSSFAGYVDPSDWRTITGTVVFAGNAGTAGNMVVVKTSTHYYRFLHLNKITVKQGQKVGNMYKGKTIQQWYKRAIDLDKSRNAWRANAQKYLKQLRDTQKALAAARADLAKSKITKDDLMKYQDKIVELENKLKDAQAEQNVVIDGFISRVVNAIKSFLESKK